MKRERVTPRSDWQQKLEAIGLTFHSLDGVYWIEDACYAFTAEEIDLLESVTADLHARCLEAVEQVIRRNLFDRLAIPALFKLYPWEWLAQEAFGSYLASDPMKVIEPCWKMVLSNKGILAVLWDLFPAHPNLLPAYFDPKPLGTTYVKKPLPTQVGSFRIALYRKWVRNEVSGVRCQVWGGLTADR